MMKGKREDTEGAREAEFIVLDFIKSTPDASVPDIARLIDDVGADLNYIANVMGVDPAVARSAYNEVINDAPPIQQVIEKQVNSDPIVPPTRPLDEVIDTSRPAFTQDEIDKAVGELSSGAKSPEQVAQQYGVSVDYVTSNLERIQNQVFDDLQADKTTFDEVAKKYGLDLVDVVQASSDMARARGLIEGTGDALPPDTTGFFGRGDVAGPDTGTNDDSPAAMARAAAERAKAAAERAKEAAARAKAANERAKAASRNVVTGAPAGAPLPVGLAAAESAAVGGAQRATDILGTTGGQAAGELTAGTLAGLDSLRAGTGQAREDIAASTAAGLSALGAGLSGARSDIETGFGGAREDILRSAGLARGDITAGVTGAQRGLQQGFGLGRADLEAGFGLGREDVRAAEERARADILSGLGVSREDIQAALGRARGDLESGFGLATGDIQQAAARARGDISSGFGRAEAMFDPYTQAGSQALQQQLALSGALGPEAFRQAYEESPQMQFLREQGERAALRTAAARGGVGGGNVMKELSRFNTGLASQDLQQQIANLQALSAQGLGATGSAAGIATGGAQNLANIATGEGQNLANLRASQAQNLANLEAAAGQNLANLQTGGAQNLANITTGTGQTLSNLAAGRGQGLASIATGYGQNLANLLTGGAQNLAGIATGAGQNVANIGTTQAQNLANLGVLGGTSALQAMQQQGAQLSNLAQQLGVRESDLLTGLGAGRSNIALGVGTRAADLAAQTGLNVAGMRTRAGEQLAGQFGTAASQLADLQQAQGAGTASMIGAQTNYMNQLQQAAAAGDAQAQTQLAQLQANINMGIGSNLAGVPAAQFTPLPNPAGSIFQGAALGYEFGQGLTPSTARPTTYPIADMTQMTGISPTGYQAYNPYGISLSSLGS